MSAQIRAIDRRFDLDDLPNEIILSIIGNLSIRERINVRCLNRRWRQLAFIDTTDLYVGKHDTKFTILPCPEKSVFFVEFRHNKRGLKILKLLIQECGHFLKNLNVDFDSAISKWSEYDWEADAIKIFSLIHSNCPNLVGLRIHSTDKRILNNLFMLLVPRYKQQLECTFLNHQTQMDTDVCEFAIEHLCPEHLRALSLSQIDQQGLDKVVDKFRLLSKVEFGSQKGEIDFECLKKLTQLQEFHCDFPMSKHNFCTLMSLSFAQNLIKVNLNFGSIFIPPSFFELLKNLISLRSLGLILKNSRDFLACWNALKWLNHLEYFELNCWINKSDENQMQNVLTAISRLNHLKHLSLNLSLIMGANFSFLFFDSMPWVTSLKIILKLHQSMVARRRDHRRIDVQNLAIIFPNLIHLHVEFISDFCDLMECVDNLQNLQSLGLYYYGYGVEEKFRLSNYCHNKGISLKIGK